MFRDLGFDRVTTVLASGNVRFEADAAASARADLTETIERALGERFDYEAWIVLVTMRKLDAAIAGFPFDADDAGRQPYVVFCRDRAVRDALAHTAEDSSRRTISCSPVSASCTGARRRGARWTPRSPRRWPDRRTPAPRPPATSAPSRRSRPRDRKLEAMSGHSKWATTKHKKAVIDARRAKSWAKLIKNIEVAAKLGGPDLQGNPTLFDAVLKAKKTSVPKDNIDRAIKRGAGIGGESVEYLNIMYEGYAPGGVALMIECLTDNKNRAAAEVRTALSRNGGTLADPGSVAYNFTRKGVIVVSEEGTTEDDVMMAALEAGAEEIEPHAQGFEVITEASDLVAVRSALQGAGIEYESADVEFVPNLKVEIDAETARKIFRLIDALEDSDDVQNVFSNFDLSAEVQAELEQDE
ncbi:YebC/PmpR family DNA-binding transcriptional regulator [Pseudoxanthomonas mexicana]